MENQQINSFGKIIVSRDVNLKPNELLNIFIEVLGADNASIEAYSGQKKYIKYTNYKKDVELILCRNITYMGNPHALDRKRIQIPKWFQDFYFTMRPVFSNIRLIGVYTFDDTNIFVEFNLDDYFQNNINNSSAHVSVDDLRESFTINYYRKKDKNNNKITVINKYNLYDYLMKI